MFGTHPSSLCKAGSSALGRLLQAPLTFTCLLLQGAGFTLVPKVSSYQFGKGLQILQILHFSEHYGKLADICKGNAMGDGGVVALLALAADTLRPSNAGIDIRLAKLDGFTVVFCEPKARSFRDCMRDITGFQDFEV